MKATSEIARKALVANTRNFSNLVRKSMTLEDLDVLRKSFNESSASSVGLVREMIERSESLKNLTPHEGEKIFSGISSTQLRAAKKQALEQVQELLTINKIIAESLLERENALTTKNPTAAKSEIADPTRQKKILMIGYGNMGRPIAKGMVENFGNGMELSVVNPSPRQLPAGVKYYSSVDGLPKGEKFDVVFVSVKPQIAPTVLPKYKEFMADGAIVLSIMAGTQIKTIQEMLGENVRVVRTMPSICADVGKSPTGVARAKGDNFSEAESELVTKLIQSFGEVVPVEENRINAITAVAGSGPAYVCHVLESATQALTKHCGLEYEEAKKLVLDTAIKGFRPSEQKPDLTRVEEVLKNLEDKDSVANLIDKTVEAGKDDNLATMAMIVDGILLRVKSAYITGAKKLGFSQEDAEKLVSGTMVGTAELAAAEGAKPLPDLEGSVVSLRGTTEAGLGKLKSAVNGRTIDEIFPETLQAAFDRAEELGNGLGFSAYRARDQIYAAEPQMFKKAEVVLALSALLEVTISKLIDDAVTKKVNNPTASQLAAKSKEKGERGGGD